MRTEDAAAAFGRLFDDHARARHAYLAARVGRSVADGLVAEVFLVAFRDRQRFDPTRGEARAWLFGIATNLARRHRRSELRGLAAAARFGSAQAGHAEEPDRWVPDRVDAAARVARLATALAELAPDDRDVLYTSVTTAVVDESGQLPPG